MTEQRLNSIEQLRARIDQLDEQILLLLNERAECALDVANVKMQESDGEPAVFYRPEREAQVLRRLANLNDGPLTDEKVAFIFREIMSACLALEEPLKVAYLGPAGTFTQMASQKRFGGSVVGIPLMTVDDVFREVAAENCNYGVVPVENSSEGVISHTLDNFLSSTLKICGEIEIRVHHHLMASPETNVENFQRVYAHQQTLGQCRDWLNGHLPNLVQIATTSNAEAARRAAGDKESAAIAGEIAADIYDLKILSRQIEDQQDNTTRFIVVGRENIGPSGNDKTSIMISTHNQPGALFKLLEPFHRHNLSLTSIETRPSRTGMWSYVFFIDFEGHRDDVDVLAVLTEIDSDALEVKLLGSYPRALG